MRGEACLALSGSGCQACRPRRASPSRAQAAASAYAGRRMQVDLVTRAGCHLCEVALDELRALGVEPRLRDVDGDPDLFTQFDFRVPILLVEERVVGEGNLGRAALARALGLADVQVVR